MVVGGNKGMAIGMGIGGVNMAAIKDGRKNSRMVQN
jgi:hypothetical protein